VRLVLGRDTGEAKFASLAEIGCDFQAGLRRVLTGAVLIEATAPSSNDRRSFVVEYTDSGDAVGLQRMALLRKGFKENSTVVRVEGNVSHYYILKVINPDGTCELQPIDGRIGDLKPKIEVAYDDVHLNYKCVAGLEFAAYPAKAPMHSDEYVLANAKAVIQAAVCAASEGQLVQVRLRVKPSKLAMADADFKTGQLTIWPETCRIKSVGPGETSPPRPAIQVKTNILTGFVFFLLPHSGASFQAPFWDVGDSVDDVNMKIKYSKVSVSTTVGSRIKLVDVHVPCWTNTRAVHKDTVLLAMAPPKTETTKRIESVSAVVSKRQKLV
jgi:hypothetical protein